MVLVDLTRMAPWSAQVLVRVDLIEKGLLNSRHLSVFSWMKMRMSKLFLCSFETEVA